MPRHAAFLRGINVSGRRATSDQLRSCFEAAGFADVATFRASGNVVFDAKGGTGPERLAATIAQALEDSLGYQVATFVRTAAEIRAIAAHDPFDARLVNASKGKLQVVMLSARPTARVRKAMLALQSEDDLLAIEGRELYWLPSGGLMESAIGMSGITDVLGPNTMRTKGTIEQIAARYFGG